MNATELRERIESLHCDARTASHNHSSELIGLLGQAATVARKEEMQTLCSHPHPPLEQRVTNAVGRFLTKSCPVCFKLIKLEELP